MSGIYEYGRLLPGIQSGVQQWCLMSICYVYLPCIILGGVGYSFFEHGVGVSSSINLTTSFSSSTFHFSNLSTIQTTTNTADNESGSNRSRVCRTTLCTGPRTKRHPSDDIRGEGPRRREGI